MSTLTLEPVKVAEGQNYHIEHFSDLATILFVMHGDISDAEFRLGNRQCVQACMDYQAKSVIVDESNVTAWPTAGRIWLTTKFAPTKEVKGVMRGLREMIVVKTTNRFTARMSKVMQGLVIKVTGINLKQMETQEEAFGHIEKQNHLAY